MNDAGTPTARFPGVPEGEIVSVARIADEARRDPLFQDAREVYRDDWAFDVLALVSELVASEAVPALPVERYRESGLLKRTQWERTWELQRADDAIDARVDLPDGDPKKLTADEDTREKLNTAGEIPVPPKYAQADFLPGPFWRLRGKLDVPKERFVSFPSVTTADGTPLVAWAGSDHLQLAKAVSGLLVDIRDRQGTHDDPRLLPLLAVLVNFCRGCGSTTTRSIRSLACRRPPPSPPSRPRRAATSASRPPTSALGPRPRKPSVPRRPQRRRPRRPADDCGHVAAAWGFFRIHASPSLSHACRMPPILSCAFHTGRTSAVANGTPSMDNPRRPTASENRAGACALHPRGVTGLPRPQPTVPLRPLRRPVPRPRCCPGRLICPAKIDTAWHNAAAA
jgi:hypothetical protein